MIPYGRQSIDDDDIKAVVEVLRSDFLTTGPKVVGFEQAVADYVGSKYAVAVSSGTAALHCAVFALNIGPGDEVITVPYTFITSSFSILQAGAIPVFVDVKLEDHCIDPAAIEPRITSRTKAILPVHINGGVANMDKINSVAGKNNLLVIEDACQAILAEWRGKKVGTLGDWHK